MSAAEAWAAAFARFHPPNGFGCRRRIWFGRTVGRLAKPKLAEAPWERYANSADFRLILRIPCNVTEGDSPNVARYLTAKRPSSTNWYLRATAATLAFDGSARCRADRALPNRCNKRYREGLTPRNSLQHFRNVRSGTPISAQIAGTVSLSSLRSPNASSKRTTIAARCCLGLELFFALLAAKQWMIA